MDDTTILGATFGQLGQTAKKTVQQIVKLPEEMGGDVSGQVGGTKPAATAEDLGKQNQGWQSDEDRVKFLRDLYGPSQDKPQEQTKKQESKPQTTANPLVSKVEKPSEFQEQIKDKSSEEQKKMLELRNQLHKENYYDLTFNRPKPQEERPAEKVENEKKQEMTELQQKEEKKPKPLAVQREQNKAETFRGASG